MREETYKSSYVIILVFQRHSQDEGTVACSFFYLLACTGHLEANDD